MKTKAFVVCYYTLMLFAYIFMLPILCFFSVLKPKYRHSLPARFFMWNNSFKMADFTPEIWIHACSLGEINSLKAILNKKHKNILLTTTTNTGFERANELFLSHNVAIRYLPFEIFIPFIMPKDLKKLVVLEAELWFMLFFCAKICGAKCTLLNARISTKSYPKYKKNTWFYKNLFNYVDEVLCQQDIDKERLSELGAKNITAIGNIKALTNPIVTKNLPKFAPSIDFVVSKKHKDLHKNPTLIIAASTHRGEEELILRSYKVHFTDSPLHRLIIAPRHPERFGEVWDIIKAHNFRAIKYSENGLNYESNVILLDKLGELINVYAIADCVILGGSFVNVGGHNPLECAFFGTKLISGEYIFNQLSLFSLVKNYIIAKNNELCDILGDLERLEKSEIDYKALNAIKNNISEILTN